MSTIRVARRHRFTPIDRRTINDARLSFRARGVLAYLLDKPDDWRTDSEAIARDGAEGRDAVRAALAELELCGYLRRSREQDAAGLWSTDVVIFERPEVDPTDAGFSVVGATSGNAASAQVGPTTGKPTPGKPTVGEPGAIPNPETNDCDTATRSGSTSRGPREAARDRDDGAARVRGLRDELKDRLAESGRR